MSGAAMRDGQPAACGWRRRACSSRRKMRTGANTISCEPDPGAGLPLGVAGAEIDGVGDPHERLADVGEAAVVMESAADTPRGGIRNQGPGDVHKARLGKQFTQSDGFLFISVNN